MSVSAPAAGLAAYSLLTFRNSQGEKSRGTLLKLSRTTVVFEAYNPNVVAQLSEVLQDLTLWRKEKVVYQGKGVITNLVNTGLMLVCSATLVDVWNDFSNLVSESHDIASDVREFVDEVSDYQSLQPAYKLVVGEIRNFFYELSQWLEQIEIFRDAANDPVDDDKFKVIVSPLLGYVNKILGKFESEAALVSKDRVNIHKSFAQRDIHPLIMMSPFVYHAYHKPHGYAGDYEMVNIMVGQERAGSTVFAQFVNTLNLRLDVAVAHRNRIAVLEELVVSVAQKANLSNRCAEILNVGCGPAVELQRFINSYPLANRCKFRLVDFNKATLDFVETRLKDIMASSGNNSYLELRQQTVQALLKEASASPPLEDLDRFDFVYCAGLFDYLSDKVCNRLLKLFYRLVRPGGKVLVTNVHPKNPNRYALEHILEWHLVYRDEQTVVNLSPFPDFHKVYTDSTGVNVFLEICKPGINDEQPSACP